MRDDEMLPQQVAQIGQGGTQILLGIGGCHVGPEISARWCGRLAWL